VVYDDDVFYDVGIVIVRDSDGLDLLGFVVCKIVID
jgi:hypothetical protein